ncbi:MAG: hypothetical protein H7328_00990 [Bdellovibrio sp.]|nr:hypothetical protein [Bdellovibrio sp.]
MKNSLSKTLLCGVLASTFLLVNCQKAPSRGVKAGTTEGVADKTAAVQKIVECTPEYLTAFKATGAQLDKVSKQVEALNLKVKTEKISEVEKSDLTKDLLELTNLKKSSDAAAAKLKDADGCNVVMDAKGTKKAIIFKDLQAAPLALGTKVATLTGEENDLSKADKEKKAQDLLEKGAKSLSAGMELLVGKILADALDDSQKDGASYFITGQLKTDGGFKVATEDKKITVCYVTLTGGKVDEKSKLKIIEVAAVTQNAKFKRKALTISAQSTAGLVGLECLLSETSKYDANAEFRNGFGGELRPVEAKAEDKKVGATETNTDAQAVKPKAITGTAKAAAALAATVSADVTKAVSTDATKAISISNTVSADDTKAAVAAAIKERDAAAAKEAAQAPAATEQNTPAVTPSGDASKTQAAVKVVDSKLKTQAAATDKKAVEVQEQAAAKPKAEEKGFFKKAFDSIKSIFSSESATSETVSNEAAYDAMGNRTN